MEKVRPNSDVQKARFFIDFGAVWGLKSRAEIAKKRPETNVEKKEGKKSSNEKKSSQSHLKTLSVRRCRGDQRRGGGGKLPDLGHSGHDFGNIV